MLQINLEAMFLRNHDQRMFEGCLNMSRSIGKPFLIAPLLRLKAFIKLIAKTAVLSV